MKFPEKMRVSAEDIESCGEIDASGAKLCTARRVLSSSRLTLVLTPKSLRKFFAVLRSIDILGVEKTMRFLIAVVLLITSAFAPAEDATTQAVKRLTHVGVFAFGGVGFAGRISEGQKDFMLIMVQPPDTADAALRRIFRDGNVEAKSYAALGLMILHPDQSEALLGQLRMAGDFVLTQHGCVMSQERLVDVIAQLPAYQLQAGILFHTQMEYTGS